MELGAVGRASAVTTSNVVHQQSAQAGERSAAPGLPQEQTVTALNGAEAVDVQISDDAATSAHRLELLRQVIARRVEVDPESRQLLFQSVRQRTGEVVQQTPSDVTLKLRAYLAASGILATGRRRDDDREQGAGAG